jgi:AbrB family looped-hinge helix DNA binding protein
LKGGVFMISKIKTKNQVTIPQRILDQMDLKIGDNFEITMDGNKLILTPVALVNLEEAKLAKEVKKSFEDYKKNKDKYKKYSDVDKMFEDMGL